MREREREREKGGNITHAPSSATSSNKELRSVRRDTKITLPPIVSLCVYYVHYHFLPSFLPSFCLSVSHFSPLPRIYLFSVSLFLTLCLFSTVCFYPPLRFFLSVFFKIFYFSGFNIFSFFRCFVFPVWLLFIISISLALINIFFLLLIFFIPLFFKNLSLYIYTWLYMCVSAHTKLVIISVSGMHVRGVLCIVHLCIIYVPSSAVWIVSTTLCTRFSSNLLSVLFRCGTRPYERGTQSNSLVKVC